MSIELHPTKGVNPHMTVCRSCGKDTGIALVGINDRVITCHDCDTNNIGAKFGQKCGKCGGRLSKSADKWRTLEENEKIPDELCDECQKEADEHRAIVRDGGIYWRCSSCNDKGVVRRSEFSLGVKKQMGLKENAICGIIFDKNDCPMCGRKVEEK